MRSAGSSSHLAMRDGNLSHRLGNGAEITPRFRAGAGAAERGIWEEMQEVIARRFRSCRLIVAWYTAILD
jgi:hypothetical protein